MSYDIRIAVKVDGADMRGEKNADYWVGTEGDEE